MGFFRLLLAALVAVSHTGVKFFNFGGGTIVTVPFFILSGYVMTLVIQKYYIDYRCIKLFYMDRYIRLMPQFVAYIFIAIVIYFAFGADARLQGEQKIYGFPFNIIFMMPQLWSLALEASFYVAAPFLLIYGSPRHILMIALVSFAFFIASFFQISDSLMTSYRFLPGSIFIFLSGWSLAGDAIEQKMLRVFFIAAMISMLSLFFLKNEFGMALDDEHVEIVIGCLLGFFVIFLGAKISFGPMTRKLDELCALLSYGVFLNHSLLFLLLWQAGFASYILLLFFSALASYVSYTFVEKPFVGLRKSLRMRPEK